MAANAEAEPQQSQSTNKSKKHKKKKSKAANAQNSNGNHTQANGASEPIQEDNEDENADAEEPPTPTTNDAQTQPVEDVSIPERPASNARRKSSVAMNGQDVKGVHHSQHADPADTATRLDAALQERDGLRDEVATMRKELEDIRSKHDGELGKLREEVEQANTEKVSAQSKYDKLYGQVNNIKMQIGERMKADAAQLEEAHARVDQLEEERKTNAEEKSSLESELAQLRSENAKQSKEVESLRGRTNLSQQNWAKERDDLVSREAAAREEFEATRQAMQDWEVLAMEERSLREGLSERVAELEDTFNAQKESYERAVAERDDQSNTVDSLQRALKEVHDARKDERRELVESAQTQANELRAQLAIAESSLREAQDTLGTAQTSAARLEPLEKEIKEKTLLIGKLRHEAVILNDHLTKALRFLKRAKPDDNVDRQLVSNHFLQFLALDRSDPKKFQILMLISALLGWSEEQKEQAGLARPGATSNSGSLKVPLSAPFRRVSSSAGLNPLSPTTSHTSGLRSPSISGGSFDAAASPARGEGLAELWSEFLEREAEEGQGERSRRGSMRQSSGASTPKLRPSPMSPATGSPGVGVQKARLDSVGEDASGGDGGG